MAKKVAIKKRTKSGDTVNLYGEKTTKDDGQVMVSVYTKYAVYGLYKIERFENGELTSSSFRKMFGDKDND